MTFIPGCERDVFISYAHDNDHDGWVTRFQKSLAAKLAEYRRPREAIHLVRRPQPSSG